jgi:tetrahydromethanopterin S-methyltransferase subunit G
MSRGMEMMLHALIKSIGIDPDDAIKKCETVRDEVYQAIANANARLERIEKKLDLLTAQSAQILEIENDKPSD